MPFSFAARDDRSGSCGERTRVRSCDECHHVSAHTFEQVVRRAKARFVLGLSATVTRKDGHHPIIFMQCGVSGVASTPECRLRRDPSTTHWSSD
jgi:hypothetical protein